MGEIDDARKVSAGEPDERGESDADPRVDD